MSAKNWQISRRTALRGLGVSVALPLLDVMMPTTAIGATAKSAAAAAPKRMAFVFTPNGMIMPKFTPAEFGRDYKLTPTLEPLAKLRDEFNIHSGLAHDNARAKGDGAGDHARSSAAFLTGAHPRKTDGKDIKLGISIDQFAANHIGDQTRLRSLELSCDKGRFAGSCDSGYSCAYSHNISWKSEQTPVAAEINPALVFERLFGSRDERASGQQRARRLARRKSILDYVAEDAKALERSAGVRDRQKLDEYQTAIREIERRVEHSQAHDQTIRPPAGTPEPTGVPPTFSEHIRLMYDMLAVAFQTDLTRVATFMHAAAGSNRSFRDIGVSDGHHSISHHNNNQTKVAKIEKIDRFYVEQYAYFIDKLGNIPEGDGRLLDNCMIMLGSGIADGNRHSHHDLPVLLAGQAGGQIKTGFHHQHSRDTPLCNLFLNMLDHMQIPAKRFGDSSGRLRTV